MLVCLAGLNFEQTSNKNLTKQKLIGNQKDIRHTKCMMQDYAHTDMSMLLCNTTATCRNRLVVMQLPVTAAGSYFVSFVSTKPKF